ncbi:hypothetical protein JB92DRAFT_2832792 [Gautieria morchelliformis]|nr:hypothetical protein JB92DRAFT_2832792 [Gautieria morchelliformis]
MSIFQENYPFHDIVKVHSVISFVPPYVLLLAALNGIHPRVLLGRRPTSAGARTPSGLRFHLGLEVFWGPVCQGEAESVERARVEYAATNKTGETRFSLAIDAAPAVGSALATDQLPLIRLVKTAEALVTFRLTGFGNNGYSFLWDKFFGAPSIHIAFIHIA